jgi:hypothetical protein
MNLIYDIHHPSQFEHIRFFERTIVQPGLEIDETN